MKQKNKNIADQKPDCRTCILAGPEEPLGDKPGSGLKCWCPIRNRMVAVGIQNCNTYEYKKNEQQKRNCNNIAS